MKNTLRVAKKSEYVIEVNDIGETISFNIEDPSLPLRAEKTYDDLRKITNDLKIEIAMIEKNNDNSSGSILTKKNKAILQAYDSTFKMMRKIMDQFLGRGACQKIFGDSNYLTMYDELFEQLTPHFEKMGINSTAFIESIEKKYGDNDEEDTLEA